MDDFAWRVAADRFRGYFVRDPNAGPHGSLVVEVEGIPITGKAEITTTTFRAPVPGPSGLHLHVLHRSRYGHIRLGSHGFPHLPLGAFRVDASDRDYAALWLTAPVCEQLRAVSPKRYEFELRDEVATAMAPAFHERDPASLIAAIRALAAFANRTREVDAAWVRATTAIGGRVVAESWRPTGNTSAVVSHRGETVRLDVYVGGDDGPDVFGLHTRLRCERRTTGPIDFFAIQPSDRPPIQVHLPAALRTIANADLSLYVATGSAFTPMARRLTPATCRAVEAVSPSLLLAGARDVQLYLRGFVADPGRLRAAAALVVELAVETGSASRGPYR